MRRREFLALTGVALASPRLALAQQAAKVPRLALVSGALPVTSLTSTGDAGWAAFIQEMVRLGFVEGRTVHFERYLALPQNAQEVARLIVASAPDLVFAAGPYQPQQRSEH